MRFPYVFVVGFFLISGVFTNVPISVMMAVPAPKIIEENNREADKKTSKPSKEIADPANEETRENTQTSPANAETQKEKSVQSKEIIDPASEKKESVQNLPAEKPKASSASPVDYGKIIEQQLSDFLERDLSKNIAALPLKPIATVAISNLPDGLKKAFLIGDKVYPGFSTLAQLFISGAIGGSDCPGVDPNAPCYVLLFPHGENVVSPLICFKATPESLIVKNLQSEANKAGEYQLIELPLPKNKLPKKQSYKAWAFGSKALLSALKDFSSVVPFFEDKTEQPKNTFCIDLDVDALSAFMPLPVLKLTYDTYIKKDFEKIIFSLDIDNKELKISSRHQIKSQTPWSVFCKAINERKKTFRSLNFPSNAAIQTAFCWDPTSSKSLLKSLLTYAKEAEWKQDPIAYQVYQLGQMVYPICETYLNFMEVASTGNGQFYNIQSGSFNGFGLEELKPSVTNRQLVGFLKLFTEKCTQQLVSAQKEQLLGSNRLEGFTFKEEVAMFEGCNIHKCAVKVRKCGSDVSETLTEYALFTGVYKGYLLYAGSLENMKLVLEQMQAMQTFSYCSHPDAVALSRIALPKDVCAENIEAFRNTELAPETFITTVNIPLSLLEAVKSLVFGNTGSDKSKDKSEDARETEKTNKSNVTNEPSNVSEPTRAPKGEQNVSDPAVPAQPAAVR